MLVTAGPAGAIIGGTDDTQNRFLYVGVLQLNTGTDWFDFCPGTLVAPDIVLTASHCTDFFTAPVGQPGLGPDDLRVSFALPRDETSAYYLADHLVIHPDWLVTPPGSGNSKHGFL